MVPKHLVWIGGLLIAVPLLLALLSAAWLWVPIGLFVLGIGVVLYGFKRYHERRMEQRFEPEN